MSASGELSAVGASLGAIGALVSGLNPTPWNAIASALLIAFVFGERTLRIRERRTQLVHVTVALVTGGLGGALATSFASSALALHGIAVTMAAILVAAPLLIDADDTTVHTLDGLAAELGGATGETLTRAAELRRNGDTSLIDRDREMRAHVARTWVGLVNAARSRARLERSRATGCVPPKPIVERSDRVIAHHVTFLLRAYGAYEALDATNEALLEVESLC